MTYFLVLVFVSLGLSSPVTYFLVSADILSADNAGIEETGTDSVLIDSVLGLVKIFFNLSTNSVKLFSSSETTLTKELVTGDTSVDERGTTVSLETVFSIFSLIVRIKFSKEAFDSSATDPGVLTRSIICLCSLLTLIFSERSDIKFKKGSFSTYIFSEF